MKLTNDQYKLNFLIDSSDDNDVKSVQLDTSNWATTEHVDWKIRIINNCTGLPVYFPIW